jgi:hypothetical protein
MTDRNHFTGALSMIQYPLDNAIHRRFKERSNIGPKKMDPVHDNAMLHWRNHSPHELQAAVSNVIGLIIIPRVPKFDVLWFFSFYEASFHRLIKGSNDSSISSRNREPARDVNIRE